MSLFREEGVNGHPLLRRSGLCGDALLVAELFGNERVKTRGVFWMLVVPAQ